MLWGGTPARLITAARAKDIALWSSPVIDADDDKVLATGLGARAHLIVSGDHKHLVILKQFHGIPIITAAQAVAMVEAR